MGIFDFLNTDKKVVQSTNPVDNAYADAGMNRKDIIDDIRSAERLADLESQVLTETNKQKTYNESYQQGVAKSNKTYDKTLKVVKDWVADQRNIDYYTAAQGRLYIGGIQIDECYDIQYQYREAKEPVYGYNSKFFDAVLPGTVLVTGSFTINYKHDQYLFKTLDKIRKDTKRSNQNKVQAAWNRRSEAEKAAEKYKNTLRTIKANNDRIKELQRTLSEKQIKLQEKQIILKENAGKDKYILEDFKLRKELIDQKIKEKEAALGPKGLKKVKVKIDSFNEFADIYKEDKESATSELNKLGTKVFSIQADIEKDKAKVYSLESSLQKISHPALSPENKTEADRISKELQDTLANINNNKLLLTDTENEYKESKKLWADMLDIDVKATNKAIEDSDTKEYLGYQLALTKLDAEQEDKLQQYKNDHNKIQSEYSEAKTIYDNTMQNLSQLQTNTGNGVSALKKLKDEMLESSHILKQSIKDVQEAVYYSKGRAEDFGLFTIFLDYNDQTHKILEDCTFTGHSHVLSQSGEAVREYYTFFARKVR